MESQVETVTVGAEPFIDDITTTQVARALGLERHADIKKYQDQIKRLIDWAKEKGSKDDTDIVWSIKQLGNKVGSPKLGNNWAQHLSQYAYLEMERMKLDKQLNEYASQENNPA